MKKTFLIFLAAAAMLSAAACKKKQPTELTDDKQPDISAQQQIDIDNEPENAQNPFENNENSFDIEQETATAFNSSINNILNGAMLISADDYIIFGKFEPNPEDEYIGGEYRLYRANRDFSEPQLIYEPYFMVHNMCIYDGKLYFTSGGGGGRHMFGLDLDTLECKALHDNLSSDDGLLFIDSLQLVDGMLYFEYNGSFCRMKPDQSEFEILYDGEYNFSLSMLGVADGYIFYGNYNDDSVRRLELETGEETVFLESFMDGCINFYDGRIYYTDAQRLISSDLDGIEKRTVFELDENKKFHALNICDGYVYYVATSPADSGQPQELYEYNLHGGENRLLHSGVYLYQLTAENGKLYFYESYTDFSDNVLKELDPKTLTLKVIE